MKGIYQLFCELIGNIVTSILGLFCLCFGMYIIFTKNEKIKNKKRGIFLAIAGFIIFAYHFVNIIIYFLNK